MIYLELFWEFFKTGLFAIGGGMATLPFLYNISNKTNWFTNKQIADMVAISESTPGPIGVNMATYAGFLTAKIPGSFIATIGLILPSLIIILIVSTFINKVKDNKYAQKVFYLLRPTSVALITVALIIVSKTTFIKDTLNFKAIILIFILLIFTNIVPNAKRLHPIIWILLSGILGIVFKF